MERFAKIICCLRTNFEETRPKQVESLAKGELSSSESADQCQMLSICSKHLYKLFFCITLRSKVLLLGVHVEYPTTGQKSDLYSFAFQKRCEAYLLFTRSLHDLLSCYTGSL